MDDDREDDVPAPVTAIDPDDGDLLTPEDILSEDIFPGDVLTDDEMPYDDDLTADEPVPRYMDDANYISAEFYSRATPGRMPTVTLKLSPRVVRMLQNFLAKAPPQPERERTPPIPQPRDEPPEREPT